MTDFYADYIKKTTFDPESHSVRTKLEEAATDTKKKQASKTPKLEVEPTEIPEKKEMEKEELHGDQHKLDHNKDMKITASDMKTVRKKGAVKNHPAEDTTDEAMVIRSKKSSAKLRRDAESRPMGVREDDEELEEATFRVSVSGLPTMHVTGSSAGEIKTSLRKMLKDPKALGNIEKITPSEKKSDLRAKMSEDQTVAELDKKTMGSYVKKAAHDLDNRSFTQGMRDNNPKYTSADAKNNAKIRSRRAGIDRAVNKMSEDQTVADYLKKGGKITKVPAGKAQGAHGDSRMASGIAGRLSSSDTSRFKTKKKVKSMEDVEQVDEISKRAKAAYTRVAARDLHHQGSKAAQGVANNDRSAVKKADRNINNRLQGIDRATKSLQKEGAMKRIATQDAEKERLGPKVKGSGLDTFKKKPMGEKFANAAQQAAVMADIKASGKYKKPKESVEEKDTHVTKDGKTAKKGLWYNIHQKRKRGGKPNPPGHPDRPSASDLKRSQ